MSKPQLKAQDKRTKTLTIRVSPKEHRKFKAWADKKGVSFTTVVREALNHLMSK